MIRGVLRWVLAAFYAAAGYLHLVRPEPFLSIMPSWVPAPEAVVLWTGVAELLGAAALVQWASPRLRRAASCTRRARRWHVLGLRLRLGLRLSTQRSDRFFALVRHVLRDVGDRSLGRRALLGGGCGLHAVRSPKPTPQGLRLSTRVCARPLLGPSLAR